MTFLWVVTGVALVTAVLALRLARQNARRLEQLSQMYWTLKYQHGELRSQLQTGQASPAAAPPAESAPPPANRAQDSFVPLSSLRR